jgi:hypothetical protein
MPTASALKNITSSPAETVLEMIGGILNTPKMDIHTKLAALRELCVERITFDSPEQAVKIISALADIISSDPEPEVRIAALEAMERMISLEQKAEAERGKPVIDWRTVNVLWREAKKQTELDIIPVAARSGAPAPESPSPPPEVAPEVFASESPEFPEGHAPSSNDISPQEAALLAVQENAVAAVKQAHVPIAPPSPEMLAAGPIADRPQPSGAKTPAVEEKAEPPIMKFLRSVADTDNEEHIRVLANRIIEKIETLTALKPPTPQTPAPTEG